VFYVALALVVVLVVREVMASRERDRQAKLLADFSKEWAEERAELLTRIQHPHLVPVRAERRDPAEPPKDYSPAMRSIGRAVPLRDEGDEE
jgi:hypothetical protein